MRTRGLELHFLWSIPTLQLYADREWLLHKVVLGPEVSHGLQLQSLWEHLPQLYASRLTAAIPTEDTCRSCEL